MSPHTHWLRESRPAGGTGHLQLVALDEAPALDSHKGRKGPRVTDIHSNQSEGGDVQPKMSAQDDSPTLESVRLKTSSRSQVASMKPQNSFSFAKTKSHSPSSQLCHGLLPYLMTPSCSSPPKYALPSLRIKTNLQALKQGFSTLGTNDIWCQVILWRGGGGLSCPLENV